MTRRSATNSWRIWRITCRRGWKPRVSVSTSRMAAMRRRRRSPSEAQAGHVPQPTVFRTVGTDDHRHQHSAVVAAGAAVLRHPAAATITRAGPGCCFPVSGLVAGLVAQLGPALSTVAILHPRHREMAPGKVHPGGHCYLEGV